MAEGFGRGRGRGRAALFGQKVPATDEELQTDLTAAPPKPRGRASFMLARSTEDTASSVSVPSDLGSDGDRSKTESGSCSTDERKPKPMGRAALFGSKSSSSGVYSLEADVQKLEVKDTVKKSPDPVRVSPDYEKPAPVVMRGMSGRKVDVKCNYVKLEFINPKRGIWEYDVSFQPEVDHKVAKIRLVNQHLYSLGGKVKTYDGGARLWMPMETEDEFTSGVYELKDGTKVKVTFRRRRLKKFTECHRILNIIFKRIMSELHLVRFGRAEYNPLQKHLIHEHKLEIWPGCISTIEEYEGGILMNLDASHRVLQSYTILDMIMDIFNARSGNFEADVQKALLGESVLTRYNNRMMRIDDIDFKKNPLSTFEKNGKQITYVEYYHTQYNIDIKDKGQPLLMSKVKKMPIGKENEVVFNYYVPELCYPTSLTDAQRSNFRIMKDVNQITQLIPQRRDRALTDFLKGIHANENCKRMLDDWGLKLPVESIALEARTLDPETLYFGQNRTAQEPMADWGRAMSSNRVLYPENIDRWVIIYTARDARTAENFCAKCFELASKCGIKISQPIKIKIDNDKADAYCAEIRRNKNTQIVVTIFPSLRDDRYSAVKKLCNVNLGLPSQVIISKTLSKESRALNSVVSKILYQMNCKLGGALWGVSIPYKEDGVMFCGVDVYHEAGHRGASIIALVASINTTATRWTSSTCSHSCGQEISDFITKLFRDCLSEWYKINGSYPKRIIMYRDGVGDGQLRTVRDFEIPQLKKMFAQVSSEYAPSLTYVIVQKRINTRYYLMNRNTRAYENPPPGTVLDHTVTRRDWYDFFLVSQNVRQGTVAPTHYVVVEDSSGMKPDQVQRMTYKLTHLYYNWNGTVRVPAPTQYAHKLAYLVGQFVHQQAHENLRNTLYFL